MTVPQLGAGAASSNGPSLAQVVLTSGGCHYGDISWCERCWARYVSAFREELEVKLAPE
jgi:hypothetical protein